MADTETKPLDLEILTWLEQDSPVAVETKIIWEHFAELTDDRCLTVSLLSIGGCWSLSGNEQQDETATQRRTQKALRSEWPTRNEDQSRALSWLVANCLASAACWSQAHHFLSSPRSTTTANKLPVATGMVGGPSSGGTSKPTPRAEPSKERSSGTELHNLKS